MIDFRQKVKETAKKQGLTLKQLAANLNMSEAGLNVILKKGNPTLATTEKIANQLGMNALQLLLVGEAEARENSHGIRCPHCGREIELFVKS